MNISDKVLIEVVDRVAIVTLNRTPVNAIDRDMRHSLIHAFDQLGERRDVRCVILCSTTSSFSAGVDLKDRPNPDADGDLTQTNRLTRETLNAIRECAKPVIAAVNGPALGLGAVLAISCDIVVASDQAWFAMPEINVGLAGGVAAFQAFLPRSLARKLIFTGARISAKELGAYGVLDCVPHDTLQKYVRGLATELASKSPPAMRYAKRSAIIAENMSPAEAYKLEQHYTSMLAVSPDGIEARQALLEKRQPVFTED